MRWATLKNIRASCPFANRLKCARRAARPRAFALPGPAAFDFENQGPAEKGAHSPRPRQQPETEKGQVEGDGFHDIGGDKNLQAKQKGSANADFVSLVVRPGVSPMQV